MEIYKLTNFHTHTYMCGHAEGTIDDYVNESISFGFTSLGISDHAFFPEISHKGMRGEFSELSDYIYQFFSAKEHYKDTIRIYLGFEIEFMPKFLSYYDELLTKYKFDYLILGQHLTYDEDGKILEYFSWNNLNNISGVERYVNDLISGMKTGKFLYVCHPDLFMSYINEINPSILDAMDAIIEASLKYNVALELNLGGIRFNSLLSFVKGTFTYPNHIFRKKVGEKGAKVVVGYDAHSPSDFKETPFWFIEKFIFEHNLQVFSPEELLLSKREI